jgi:hypothetical protein
MATSVRVVGAAKAARNFRELGFNLVDFGDAFEQIGVDFRDQVRRQFEGRGAFGGIRGPWAPLSPTTIRLRGGSNHQLVHHRNLIRSYANVADPQNISRIRMKTAQFGSSFRGVSRRGRLVPLAGWHQTGTRKMPERPVVLGNRFLDEQILDAFSDQLFDGWG